jgi:hypothetical protein
MTYPGFNLGLHWRLLSVQPSGESSPVALESLAVCVCNLIFCHLPDKEVPPQVVSPIVCHVRPAMAAPLPGPALTGS